MTIYTLDIVESALISEPTRTAASFSGLRLSSHFQPVYSLTHGRAVGYEALLRALDADGRMVSPLHAFHLADRAGQTVLLDRISRTMHVRNFLAQRPDAATWLFLNFNPLVLGDGVKRHGHFLREMLESAGIQAHRVVVELLESSLLEIAGLEESILRLRELGCVIAIDDFGAGHSNFDRIWRVKPDIVKLDRSMVQQAYRDPVARGLMPRIVSMLHECGALVLMEGVESESQAMIAMDSDVDFVQGYYFAQPSAGLVGAPNGGASFGPLFEVHRRLALLEQREYESGVAPYRRAIEQAAQALKSGTALAPAAAAFLELPLAERCYLLDARGHQVGASMLAGRARAQADPRFEPLADAPGGNFGRRHYFRHANARPDAVHVTRPYLSISNAELCVTVSIAIQSGAERRVLCGDIRWDEKPATGDRSIDTVLRNQPG